MTFRFRKSMRLRCGDRVCEIDGRLELCGILPAGFMSFLPLCTPYVRSSLSPGKYPEPQQILDHYVRSARAGVVPLNKNSSESQLPRQFEVVIGVGRDMPPIF